MSAPSTVPVSITPEAATRVAELGMQAELEQMIEQTRRMVPALKRIEVVLVPSPDIGDEPGITIEATRSDTFWLKDPTEDRWSEWKIQTFSPDVWRHFVLMTHHEANHAG